MSIIIKQFSSSANLFVEAAKQFLQLLSQTVAEKEFFDVALSGGSTAKEFFEALALLAKDNKDLARIRFFFSDERATPWESNDSNAGCAQRLLKKHLPLSDNQFFPMYDGKNNTEACAQAYETLLKTHLKNNAQGVPVFDLLYLGVGTDGHTASLFPKSATLEFLESDRIACSVKEDHLAHERITLMPSIINAAAQICILATGTSKEAVMREIVHGRYEPSLLPAQLVVRNGRNNVTLMMAEISIDESV